MKNSVDFNLTVFSELWLVKWLAPIIRLAKVALIKNTNPLISNALLAIVKYVNMFFKDNEVSVKYIRIITNPERQWAAVRIHWGLINEPPQNQVSFKLNPTSQGNSEGPAWIPPTIRVSSLLALPQISKKHQKY